MAFFGRKTRSNKGITPSNYSFDGLPSDIQRAIRKSIMSNSSSEKLNGSGTQLYTKCYELCPPLAAVIRKKAEYLVNGNLIPIDKDGKPISKSASFASAMKVLNSPNARMTFTEFIMYVDVCLNVYGVAYILTIRSTCMGRP